MVLCTSYRLGPAEHEILENLNFIPTPRAFDKFQLRKDLYEYQRRLKILNFFEFDRDFDHLPFQNPSTWEPKSSSLIQQTLMEQDLDGFRALKVPLAGAGGRGARQNMTGDQKRALAALKRSDNIIIKPADKGGQIVLQDRIDYLFEANRQS